MFEDLEFQELVQQFRAGDQSAATKLVRAYEPEIRRAVRVRLTDPRLRRIADSADICQSVLGNLFVRIATGQYELQKSDDLLKLLVTMSRNKITDRARREYAQRRDARREQIHAGDHDPAGPAASQETPSRQVAMQELLEEVHLRMTDEERFIADQRAMRREWSDIAQELGSNADAIRKRFVRALDRVATELGLDRLEGVS